MFRQEKSIVADQMSMLGQRKNETWDKAMAGQRALSDFSLLKSSV